MKPPPDTSGGLVVSLRHTARYDLYIGRPFSRAGHRLDGSKWANPYRVQRGGDPAEALRLYESYIRSQPALIAALPELRGKTLACWCAPPGGLTAADPPICHGQVLLRLLEEMRGA